MTDRQTELDWADTNLCNSSSGESQPASYAVSSQLNYKRVNTMILEWTILEGRKPEQHGSHNNGTNTNQTEFLSVITCPYSLHFPLLQGTYFFK
jgi:hypothetical protein